MKALIQRVSQANVSVDGEVVGEINRGLLLFLGIEAKDNQQTIVKMLDKILQYRVFTDANGKMNQSLQQVNAGLLVVSQFTLVADTNSGLRPSFSKGAKPDIAKDIYQEFIDLAKAKHHQVASGVFAADMQVSLINDGPVTFLLEI
jgi:D-tyrosyl-tRNA(Tyr) deacylase